MSVSDAERGALSPESALDQQAANLQVTAVAGVATAVFHSRAATGPVEITATIVDPVSQRQLTGRGTITIDNAEVPPRRLELTTSRTRIPANAFFVQPFLGSPYMTEVTITYRDRFGTLSSPTDAEAAASMDPVTIAAFSTLDDPETEDINEFFVLLGNGTVSMAAGSGTVFVHSFDIPGAATLRVSAQDADTGAIFERELDFSVVEPAADGAPANVLLTVPSSLLFVQDSGGDNPWRLVF